MSFLAQHHMMSNGDFVGRVNVACLTAASLIVQEEGFNREKPATARHALAALVDSGYQNGLDNFVRACALNLSIADAETAETNSSPDNDLQYVVNSSWDAVAGVVTTV